MDNTTCFLFDAAKVLSNCAGFLHCLNNYTKNNLFRSSLSTTCSLKEILSHIYASVSERIDEYRIVSCTSRSPAAFANLNIELLHQSLSALMIPTILDVSALICSCDNLLLYCFHAAKVVSNYAGFLRRLQMMCYYSRHFRE